MPIKLQTLEKKIDLLPLSENVQIVKSFLNYMNDNESSINHKINSLKSIISFGIHSDKKWVTTWNFYLNRLKTFYRWLYNHQKSFNYEIQETEWQTKR